MTMVQYGSVKTTHHVIRSNSECRHEGENAREDHDLQLQIVVCVSTSAFSPKLKSASQIFKSTCSWQIIIVDMHIVSV